MAIKKNLKDIVSEILSDMDSEGINSIADTVEAGQVASIVERTFYNLISNETIPDTEQLLRLEAFSDQDHPTCFKYPDNIKKVYRVWYDYEADPDKTNFRAIQFVSPTEFISRADSIGDRYVETEDPVSGILIKIRDDADPTYCTSFDNKTIIFNSFNKLKDTTLQFHKVRAYGALYPDFRLEDDYVPECSPAFFPLLINEAKSTAMSVLKGTIDPKVDQAARRQRYFHQDDRLNSPSKRAWNDYGRRGANGRRSSSYLQDHLW